MDFGSWDDEITTKGNIKNVPDHQQDNICVYIYIGIYIGIMGYNGKQWNICTYITISICAMVKLHGFNRIRGIWSIPQQESTHHGCLFIPLRRFMLVRQSGWKIKLLIMDTCSTWNICLHELVILDVNVDTYSSTMEHKGLTGGGTSDKL